MLLNTFSEMDCSKIGSDDPVHENYNPHCISDEDYEDWLGDYIAPTPVEWVFISLLGLLFCVGIIGNGMVMYVVASKASMRTVTNMFLFNLAVSDFQVLIVVLPFTVLWDVTETWFLGTALCKIILYCQNLSVSVSVLTLTAISMERFYAICRPLAFKSTVKRTVTTILWIWLLAMMISLPELIVLESKPFAQFQKPNFTSVYITTCEAEKLSEQGKMIYQLLMTLVLYVVPLCFMTVIYGMVAYHLWHKSVPTECGQGLSNMANIATKSRVNRTQPSNVIREIQSRRKVAKMLIMVAVLFGICFLPTHTLNILRLLRLMDTWSDRSKTTIISISRLLCYFNSIINPIVYNFMSEKFRKEFSAALLCCCKGKRGGNSPDQKKTPPGRSGVKLSTQAPGYHSSRNSHSSATGYTSVDHKLSSVQLRNFDPGKPGSERNHLLPVETKLTGNSKTQSTRVVTQPVNKVNNNETNRPVKPRIALYTAVDEPASPGESDRTGETLTDGRTSTERTPLSPANARNTFAASYTEECTSNDTKTHVKESQYSLANCGNDYSREDDFKQNATICEKI